MDFQGFVNTFLVSCAVLSVKKGVKGHANEIRIVKANDIYKTTMGVARYHDNMVYSDLVPKDLKFEDFCYRCAFQKQKLHSYVETRYIRGWSELTLIPLEGGDESLGYCAFFFEFTKSVNATKMAHVSADTAMSVIKSCITLRGSDDFKSNIKAVVTELQQKSNSFCSCIILIDKIKQKYEILCEKFLNDAASMHDYDGILTYSIVESWENTIAGSNGIIIKDEQDMQALEKKNPEWVSSLRYAYVRSLILFPLKQNRKTIGYLFITNFDTENLVEIKELIELTSFFLSSEIASHTLMEKLEHLSSTDLLTGVKNRNAMNNRVALFVRGESTIESPFGVVFADLNGLKQMNDNKGHEAGDKMIRSAAKLLNEIFKNSEIYRAGGDEFVIIMPACEKEEFEQKISDLKAKSGFDSEVCLSIGSHWNEDGENLRLSMHIADEEMYKDKNKFYEAHKEIQRCS